MQCYVLYILSSYLGGGTTTPLVYHSETTTSFELSTLIPSSAFAASLILTKSVAHGIVSNFLKELRENGGFL